jgi:cytochrome P450
MNIITIIIILLLALAPWPSLPVLLGNASRAPFLKVQLALGSMWIAWILLVVMLGFINPILVYSLACLVSIVVVFFYWRGRESYGRSTGLPKGSLALSQSLLAIVDPDFYMKAADRYGPVFKMTQFHQATICVLGLERGHRLFREHRDSFGPVSQPFNRSVAGGFLRYMDTETHAIYARLFGKALALPVLTPAVLDVENVCKVAMDAMANACLVSDSSGVSPRVYCEQVSYDAFVRVLFGLKPGTRAYAEMKDAYSGLKAFNIGNKVDGATEQSLERLRAFLLGHATSLIDNPASSPTCTLTELHRLDSTMPDRVCVDNLLFTLKISTANVASLLLWLFKILGEHPEWMRRIVEVGSNDEDDDQITVIDSVVKETLRLAQSEYLYRRLLEDVEFEGMILPKGWLVRLCVRESHRNEAVFENAADFDPDRFLRKKSGVTEYAPFGYGAHACNGIALTEIICRALLQTLASGFDWTITQDGPLERGFRHWSHWQPSSALRTQMQLRSEPT